MAGTVQDARNSATLSGYVEAKVEWCQRMTKVHRVIQDSEDKEVATQMFGTVIANFL